MMKTTWLTLALAAVHLVAFAQGKVTFGNDADHLIMIQDPWQYPVRWIAAPQIGTPGDVMSSLTAELYAGRSPSSLTLQYTMTPAGRAGLPDGRLGNAAVILTNIPAGISAYFQVRILDLETSTPRGQSPVFTAVPGSFAYTPLAASSTWPDEPILLDGCLTGLLYFLEEPRSQVELPGGTVTFSVRVAACPFPAYFQWRFNGAPIPGATQSRYQIINVQPEDAGDYSVEVRNQWRWPLPDDAWHSITSSNATLTVLFRPIITSDPKSQTAFVGSVVNFHVSVEAAPPFACQWFLDGSPLSNASTADLVLTNLQLSHAGAYTVVVTNVYGTITSAPAMLTVLASPPILELSPWSRTAVVGTFLDFVVGAVGALPLSYQWYFNGVPIAGATAPDLHFSSLQFSNSGNYAVVMTNAFGAVTSGPVMLTVVPRPTPRRGTIVAWGSNSEGQCAVPAGLSNVTTVAAGGSQSLAIDSDGFVHAWGYNSVGQSSVPPGLSNVIAVSASGFHSLALKSDGTVVAWGSDYSGQSTVPEGLHDVVAVAAGGQHSLALRSDGTVVAWGMNAYGQTNVPIGLREVTAIAAGDRHNLALKFDGTVVAWGYGYSVPTNVPPDLGGVIAIAASRRSLVLKSDGTVKAWYGNDFGQNSVPVGLRCVTAITAGWDYFNSSDSHYLALRSEGTVTAWGYGTQGLNAVPAGLNDVIAIAAGVLHNLALVSQAPAILREPVSQTAEIGATVGLGAKAAGHPPLAYQWLLAGDQAIPGATNDDLHLPGVQPEHSGTYLLVVTNTAGAVTSAPALLSVIPPVERRWVPGLTLMSQTGSTLNLDVTDTLVPAPNWAALDSVVLTNNSQWYFDLTTPLPRQRFYRAWQSGVPAAPVLNAYMIPALTLTGLVGSTVRVDGINQFGPTDAWFPLATVTLTNTSQLYFDVSVIGQPPRLWRLVQVP